MTIEPRITLADQAAGLKAAMRRFASGVTVVTAGSGDKRCGATATAFTSVTMEPPTVLVCINRSGGTHAAIAKNGAFTVNLLASDNEDVAASFAGMSDARGLAQFEPFEWTTSVNGAPALAGAQATIACWLDHTHTVGSHSIFLGRVADVAVNPEKAPLVHYAQKFWSLEALPERV